MPKSPERKKVERGFFAGPNYMRHHRPQDYSLVRALLASGEDDDPKRISRRIASAENLRNMWRSASTHFYEPRVGGDLEALDEYMLARELTQGGKPLPDYMGEDARSKMLRILERVGK